MNIDHRIHEPALPAHLLPSARNAAVLNVTATPEQIAALKEAIANEKPGEVFITTDDHVHHDIARMADEGNPHHTEPTLSESFDSGLMTEEDVDLLAALPTESWEMQKHMLTAVELERVEKRRAEIGEAARKDFIEVGSVNQEAAQIETLPGGVIVPEGFHLVGRVSYDDESTRVEFDDLRPNCDIDNIAGVTATLTRPKYESEHGYVSLRVIHDHAGVAYLFRKDEHKHTHFKVAFGGGASY